MSIDICIDINMVMAMGTGISIGFDICIGMAIDTDISIDMKIKKVMGTKKPRILSHASSKHNHKVKMKSRILFNPSYFTSIFWKTV